MRDNAEHREQRMLVRWLKMLHVPVIAPINGSRLYGSRRDRAIHWRNLTTLGASPGVPDLVIVAPAPRTRSMVAVELKRPDGEGEVSPEQRAWHASLEAHGWTVLVAHGFDDARRQLERLGYGRRE